ncbi:MAG TPA: hypothetical protein VEI01_17210 [Terriglobales bacterium]|nr:hypothetical protein [Terriglobales bacterium]
MRPLSSRPASSALACLCLFLCSSVLPLTAASASPAGPSPQVQAEALPNEAIIPGPLSAFLRMAGISQKVLPEEIFPFLARNVLAHGYVGWENNGHPTEFLLLLLRYVKQARELSVLAGNEGSIRVSGCADAASLLHIIGYRVRQECGHSNTSLVTADAERAFLTVDSGFPLPALERTLQGGPPFVFSFPASRAPILFHESDWTSLSTHHDQLVETLLNEPVIARLYWALSRNDPETRVALRQSVGLAMLLPLAPALDLYGSQICIRSGRVLVPGGTGAEAAWKELVGVSPTTPQEFIPRLLARDKGWAASYFDGLAHASREQQLHFVSGNRLRVFYEAFRSADPSADATHAMFRPAPGLLLLVERTRWDSNDQPYVPGNLETWSKLLRQKTHSKIVHDWRRRAAHWDRPDQLLEAMFAFARIDTPGSLLQAYLTLSDMDAVRPPGQRLHPQTVQLLVSRFADLSDQYLIFGEFPELSDSSITRFINTADALGRIANHTLRGNAMGMFQANVGLWQILARQDQIPAAQLDESWLRAIEPFSSITSEARLFDAGRDSLRSLVESATGKPAVSHDALIELLSGPPQTGSEAERVRQEMAANIRTGIEGQRLVPLDTLLALGAGLHDLAQGKPVSDNLMGLAGQLREFEMPRPIFSSGERTEWAPGIYNNRHTDLEMKTDLARLIKGGASGSDLEEARGQLAPFLRDTLVGFNYAYYEPPGAQVLRNNPLFVRSHDFAGDTVLGVEHIWQASELFGQGAPAGGGAHLVGSLADLPYVLAEVEQDFITPENVQALIWKEMVPGLIVSSTLPRWWNVSGTEVHIVALHQRAGEELLQAASQNESLRDKVIPILADRMAPQTWERVDQALRSGQLAEILPRILPADTFYLTAEYRREYPDDLAASGPAGQELDSLLRRQPELSWDRLSHDFGVPHPVLAQSYGLELLNLKPFPALSGYSSRLLAETWDSSNLYWARLADEKGYAPVNLNRLVPALTHRMIEKISATDLEDWPAVLRALREAGDEFRQGKFAALLPVTASSQTKSIGLRWSSAEPGEALQPPAAVNPAPRAGKE